MAQMELQLSTQKAINALEAFEKKLASTQSALGGLTTGTVGKVATELTNLKTATPNQNHAKAIGAYATAISKLGNAKSLTALTNSLTALQGVGNLGNSAASITSLAAALGSIKSPRSLKSFVDQVVRLAAVSRGAATRITSLAGAINAIQVPGSLRSLPGTLQRIGSSAGGASGQVKKLGTEFRILGGIGLGVGIMQTFQALKQIGSESMTAADGMVAFQSKMMASGKDAQGVAASFNWLTNEADRLALPISESMGAFSKLSVSLSEVGLGADTAQRVFTGFGTAFRAFGLNADQTNRAFNAVTQMFTKGSVTMEELRQQLGEVFPAFGMLATSMGVNTKELAAMMANGEVASDVLLKFADDLKIKFEAAAEFMRTTGQAAIIQYGNALNKLYTFSGEGLYRGLRDGLTDLVATMNSVPAQALANSIGTTLGTAMGVAASIAGFLAESLGVAAMVLGELGQFVYNATAGILGLVGQFTGLTGVVQGLSIALGLTVPGITGVVIALGTIYYGIQKLKLIWTAFTLTAIYPTIIAFGLIALKVVAVTIAITMLTASFMALYLWWTQGIPLAEGFTTSMNVIGQSLVAAADKVRAFGASALASQAPILNIETAAGKSAEEVKQLAIAADKASGGLTKAGAGAQVAANGTERVAEAAPKAADGLSDAADEGDSSAVAFLKAGREANKTKASLSDMGNEAKSAANSCAACASAVDDSSDAMSRAAADAARLASGYEKVASSAGKAASASKSVGGGGGGGGNGFDFSTKGSSFDFGTANSSFDFGTNRKGGTATNPGGMQRASLSAFRGAPQFAGGIANTNTLTPSLPGGGIPSILHGNEAVVPLTGSGEIPVAMSGGGGGGDVATLRSINATMGSYLSLFSTWSTDVLLVLRKIQTALTGESRTGSGISTGGGSFGGGGSLGSSTTALASNFMTGLGASAGAMGGGGGGGSDQPGKLTGEGQINGFSSGTWSEYQNLQQAYQAAQAKAAASEYELEGVRYNGGPVMYAPQKMIQVQERMDAVRNAAAALSLFQKANPSFMAMLSKGGKTKNMTGIGTGMGIGTGKNGIGDFLGGFATGTPNTSKEMRGGGMNAVLHPNEAVIPLPDGRSVPVTLPPAMERMLGERGGTGGSGGPRVTNITMNIQTPDADSFAKSQTQIQNELRANIARTQERSGPPTRRIEDPTRRLAQVK